MKTGNDVKGEIAGANIWTYSLSLHHPIDKLTKEMKDPGSP